MSRHRLHRLAPRSRPGGTLTYDVVGGTWPTFDPGLPTAQTSEFPYFSAVYGNLFDLTKAGDLVPDLATAYAISTDGLKVTIDLRTGVKFSDGTAFNASAVRWNILRYANPATNCLCAQFLKAVSSVTAPNAHTVVIHLANRYEPLMSVLTTSTGAFMVSPTAFADEGANYATAPVGAGPFKLTADIPNSSLTFAKNPGYWDAKHVYLAGANVVSVGSGPSAVSAVSSRTAQFASGLAPSDVQTAKSLNVPTIAPPALNYYMMEMNQNEAPFNNPLAREALQEATNPAAINNAVNLGYGHVTQLLEGPGQIPFYGYKVKGAVTYNPTAAAALVKQIGGLSFTFFTILNTGVYPLIAQALINQWAAVGINAQVNLTNHNVAVVDMTQGTGQAELSVYGSYVDPLLSQQTIVECGATINHYYCDQSVTHLLLKIGASYSHNAQLAYYDQLWQIVMNKDHAYVALTTAPGFDALAGSAHFAVPLGYYLYLKNVWVE